MERFPNIKNHLATYSENGDQTVYTDAHGARFTDENGQEYLCLNDISSVLGFRHPRFTQGAAELVRTRLLCHAGQFSEEKERLLGRFMASTHGDFDRVMIESSGGAAVDWSIKIARRFTGRDGIVSFTKSLHGRSFTGTWLSDTPARRDGFGSGLEHTYFAQYPSDGRENDPALYGLTDIAAIIIEPYQALSGMDSPSKAYWKWLREYTKERGILLIMDEIQTGFGKTGTLFAYENTGIVPDILLLGKGMSNGFGLGALLMSREVGASVRPNELSGGSADNAFMCGIVNLVFDIIRDEDILSNVTRVGEWMRAQMDRVLTEKGVPHSFHGTGLYFSCELPEGMAETVFAGMRKRRIFIGRTKTRVFVRSPLVLTHADAEEFIRVLKAILI